MAEKKYQYVRKTFSFDGRRYEAYGKTEEEAIEKKIEMKRQLEQAAVLRTGNMTVNQWFEQWLSTYKEGQGIIGKTLRDYRSTYERSIKPHIGRKQLKSVTEMDLQKIMLTVAGMSFSTASKLRNIIQQMFHRAARARLIPYDPSEDLELPKVSKGKRRALTKEERALFLENAPKVSGYEIFFAMLYTGMRPGEAVALTWDDVDFESHQILINKAAESGVDHKIKAPKTDAGVRIVPMVPQLESILSEIQKESGPVFTNSWGNQHTRNSFERTWRAILREMDIANGAMVYRNQIIKSTLTDDLVPYCLRHTFATDLEKAEVPINVAKEIVGHSDIQTTANIYTHRDMKTITENMKKYGESI